MSIRSPQQAYESLKRHLKESYGRQGLKQGALEAAKNHIVFERLVSHLAESDHKEWALKGGMLMNIRFPETSRATKDVDLAYWGLDKGITYTDIKRILARDLNSQSEDMFSFLVGDTRNGEMTEESEGSRTASFHIKAMLGKNLVTSFLLDVGVSDMPHSVIQEGYKTGYSDFMDYASSKFPAISKEQHFAEKIHAYTKPREKFENMRFKDLFDMSVLVDSGMDRDRLDNAINYVFGFRGTHSPVDSLDPPPESWRSLYNKLCDEHGLEEDLDSSFNKVVTYLIDSEMLADNTPVEDDGISFQ